MFISKWDFYIDYFDTIMMYLFGLILESIEKFKKSLFSLWFTIYVFILILIIYSFFYIYLISVLKLVLFLNEIYN